MILNPELTIVVVCFNSYTSIKKNLEKLKNYSTILIDNSNCEKTYNLIKNIDNIKYIKTTKNLGYGSANNIGVKNAQSKYVLILNPDIMVDDVAISVLFQNINTYKNIGIIGPSLYDLKKLRRTNGSRSILKQRIRNNKSILNFAYGNTCFDYIIGCAFLFEKKFFLDIGGFDENFFMYFEDNDLCDRVYKNNRTILEIPDSKMIHFQGLSSKINNFTKIKLSLIHKISEYIYLKKNLTKFDLSLNLIRQLLDYIQRFFFNLVFFKLKKSFQNLVRIMSIILFITRLYKLLY